MAETPLPAADAKAGVKIDYLAKRLGRLLAPLGFKRQGRRLQARVGEGEQAHWQLLQLQAGSWNDGPRGEFHVNLSLQFPAIDRVLAQRAGQAWRLERIDQPDEASGHLRERLESLLHTHAPQHPLAGSEIKIRAGTDLAALAGQLEAAWQDTAWPWLQQHGRLEAVRDFQGSLLVADIPLRIAAAVALGDLAGASRLVAAHRGRWDNFNTPALADLRTWLGVLGVDTTALPTAPAPRPPSEAQQRREATERAEEQAHADQAAALLATDQAPAPALAQGWVAEYRARYRHDPAPLTGLAAGQRIAGLPAPEREQVLLGLLAGLTAAEATAVRHPVHVDATAFELDEFTRPLLKALLTTLPEASAATCLAVVDAITTLVPRLQQDLVTAVYPWGLAELVPWLCRVGLPHHARLAPAVAQALARLSECIPARFAMVEAALHAELQQPLDPQSPLADMQRETRERVAELQAQAPPTDPAEVQRRLREYPEQALQADDKRAIAQWRRWLLRDPVSGALPLVLEPDDWGRAWNEAWQAAPAELRRAAQPLLQPWLEGLDAKPSARWQKALRADIGGFDPHQLGAWRAWVQQRLHALADTRGHTEWATTGARPGVGARLGEHSESVLLGLLWWTALDPGFSPDQRAAAWRSVAEAAWLRLKDVGARAPTVGGLALRLLAGLGGEPREWVLACSQLKAARQQAKAAERALADPVVPAG